MTVKICSSCNTEKEIPGNRSVCDQCKTRRHQHAASANPTAYLKNIFSKSRSSVLRGKRTRDIEWKLELDDLLELWTKQNGRCAISGIFLTHHKDGSGTKDHNASIDRITNARDYTPDNIQLVCYRVNLMKHTLTEDMFYWWVKTIKDFSCD